MLAAGREELRKSLAEIVRTAVKNGWVDAGKAEGWLKKLESGITLREGWPKYEVGLNKGALVVRFSSTSRKNIEREVQRPRAMGLEEGRHFTVKMPEEGRDGYVRILKEGLAYAAWLSVRGEGEQRELAAAFVEHILQRAKDKGENVRKKVEEVMEEGKAKSSQTLEGFEKKVDVNGREYTVKVLGWSAELEESESGKLLLRIKITAEVDGVRREYEITFGRYGKRNVTEGYATAKATAERQKPRGTRR
jgi:hypothetical protein